MGVAGALAQQYMTDQREFLPMLARLLKSVMPSSVQTIETGLFKKTIKGLTLTQGENRLSLVESGSGGLEASHTRVVRGIALKTESITVEEWLTMVSESLEESAQKNAQARAAMARLLGLI